MSASSSCGSGDGSGSETEMAETMKCPFAKEKCKDGTYGGSGAETAATMQCPFAKEKDGTYHDYLNLDQLLGACQLVTAQEPHTLTHDEHLFIITHQSFELWFKQVLYELDSICDIFGKEDFNFNQNSLNIVSRLQRIKVILNFSNGHFDVLETMTALEFLEFRDALGIASGSQSMQFRLLENKLGIIPTSRIQHDKRDYKEMLLSEERSAIVKESEKACNLFNLIDQWLQGIGMSTVEYWPKYKTAVLKFFQESQPGCETEDAFKKKAERWDVLASKASYDEARLNGRLRFSYEAFLGAVCICLRRNEAGFSEYFQVLNLLMDIDSLIMTWRYRHSMMVARMIGAKSGTAGSSGYHYLRSTATERYIVFRDLFTISNFLIPKIYVPSFQDDRLDTDS